MLHQLIWRSKVRNGHRTAEKSSPSLPLVKARAREACPQCMHDHILWGDIIWMARFTEAAPDLPPIGTDIHNDFSKLRSAREQQDQILLDWTGSLTDAWLDEVLVWTSRLDGKERRQPRWLLVSQLFNHQTHHRGQITTLLSQAGLDIGSTDIPFVTPSETIRIEPGGNR